MSIFGKAVKNTNNALNNFSNNVIGGLMGNTTIGTAPASITYTPGTMIPIQQSISTLGTAGWPQQAFKKNVHLGKSADNFKNLTAYLRALMACEEHCECKWCGASELERKMAIVLFLKPEVNEETEEE